MPKSATSELATVDLKGIEIFAAGTWNGHKYSDTDLDAMVSAFAELAGKIDPPVKLGHDDGQRLLQADGYPAAGWVSRLVRKGDKLIADLRDVPAKVAELISAGAYKKISSEVYWNYKEGGKTYRRVLKAIALLGADLPAVSSIGDIRALYDQQGAAVGYYDDQGRAVYVVEFAEPDTSAQPVTLEELDADLDALLANAEGVVKGKTGAPALRAFLREVKAKLRRMMGGGMPKPKDHPTDMPDEEKPEDAMPKRHSMQLFKTEVQYRMAAADGIACASCRLYQDPLIGPMDSHGKPQPGACALVEGSILPHGTCDRAEMMPIMPGAGEADDGTMANAATVTKTEGGESYPAEAFLVVPDPEKPSGWKLRVWESPTAKVTRAQLGRAAAALGPGFRGQRVQLSDQERAKAKARLRSLYRGLGAADDEIPEYLEMEEAVVTEAAMEAQYTEMQGRVETLTKRLETAEAAVRDAAAQRATAEQEAKTYAERVVKLEADLQSERDARQYSDILQTARRWQHVPGKPEEIATRLQKLAKADPEEYAARVTEYDQMEQLAIQSGLFAETGSSRAGEGGSAEAKLSRMAEARMSERKLGYAEALEQVVRENPQLHREYTRETAVKV